MMGITTISLDSGLHDSVGVHVADGSEVARWIFADEVTDPVPTMACVALATPSHSAAGEEVHIREDKLFVQLGEKSGEGRTRWILDTGATNHMTGVR